MTAARGQALVPYDVFLRGEAESEEKHEWVNGDDGCESQHERVVEVRALESDGWVTRVAKSGESITIHGRELAVDTLYG